MIIVPQSLSICCQQGLLSRAGGATCRRNRPAHAELSEGECFSIFILKLRSPEAMIDCRPLALTRPSPRGVACACLLGIGVGFFTPAVFLDTAVPLSPSEALTYSRVLHPRMDRRVIMFELILYRRRVLR